MFLISVNHAQKKKESLPLLVGEKLCREQPYYSMFIVCTPNQRDGVTFSSINWVDGRRNCAYYNCECLFEFTNREKIAPRNDSALYDIPAEQTTFGKRI